jgi:hypothetical protein
MSLAVYGLSFVATAGYAWVGGLAGMIAAHALLPRAWPPAWLLPLGGLVTAAAYRPLHTGAWDQRSILQAALISCAGYFSMAASRAGSDALREEGGGEAGPGDTLLLSVALAVLAPVYLAAAWYPHVPLLWCALVMAPAALLPGAQGVRPPEPVAGRARFGLAETALLVAAADLSQVIYEYGVFARWAPHMGVAMVCATAGAEIAGWKLRLAAPILLSVAGANYVLAAAMPGFVLNPIHSAVAGAALGWALARAMPAYGRVAALVAAGMALSFGISANLSLSWLRLALPAAGIAAWAARRDWGKGLRGQP